MFNNTFYPSPSAVRFLLHRNIRVKNTIQSYEQELLMLEPSAGKGDLLEGLRCKKHVIEKDEALRQLLIGKELNVVGEDFLTYDNQYEYDLIMMNPPFDDGAKHVLKALDIAEKQRVKDCAIRAVINAETIRNPYTNERKVLVERLHQHGATITFHNDLFKNSERHTNVEIAHIECDVYTAYNGRSVYDTIYDNLTEEKSSDVVERALSTVVEPNEVTERLHDITYQIKLYNAHVDELKAFYKMEHSLRYFETNAKYESYRKGTNKSLEDELDHIRRHYWTNILQTDDLKKHMTASGQQKLQDTLTKIGRIEINEQNVHNLILSLIQNKNSMLRDTCIDLFEHITKYHQNEYSRNIHYYNGWKTNNAFKINKKFIYPITGIYSFEQLEMTSRYEQLHYKVRDFIKDLMKCCLLLKPNLQNEFVYNDKGELENEAIRFKVFKKGTVHVWFNDLELLDQFNILAGQHFNWLPTDEEIKTNHEAKDFMTREFKPYTKQLQTT